MYPFTYVKATSLQHAAEFLAANPEARPLAGGMTLIPTLKARLAQPTHLVDISRLEALQGIDRELHGIEIGAGVCHDDVATSVVIQDAIPALAELAYAIGDPQVRNLGTLGGSVANNDPAADYPAAVLALNATIVTTAREIRADKFFQGMFATALEPGELICRIVFPVPGRAAYEKFPHPASGYAMAGVFVAAGVSGVRVAVTGAGPGVFRWTQAEEVLSEKLTPGALDGLALAPDDFNEDMHGTREYRAQLVKVMAKRAIARMTET